MNSYAVAWTIVVFAAAGMLGSIYGLYRYTRHKVWLRYVLIALFFLLLAPAPIPGYPEHLAPAFLIAFFEWAFQDQGRPAVALRILVIGAIGGVVVAAATYGVERIRKGRRQAS
jgi:hypothetical protein